MLSLASFGVDRVKTSLKYALICRERQPMNYEDICLILYFRKNWSMNRSKSYQYWLRALCKVPDTRWLIRVG